MDVFALGPDDVCQDGVGGGQRLPHGDRRGSGEAIGQADQASGLLN
jgi:hypothetical protein